LTLPADAGVEAVAAAVRRLLDEPAFRTAAERLGAAIRADEAARDAAAALVALAA
jgi:UDP:flavonoid glycosyltransferase YjiC (YdhE family)